MLGLGRDEFFPLGNDAGLACDQTFIEAVKTGDASKIRSSYEDAARSLEVTLAANKSLETGKPIKII